MWNIPRVWPNRLRPYNLRWMEECLIPEDVGGHIELKKRLPWLTLASGEHFYTPYPYQLMIENRCLDILQPDIQWVGGLTACVKICNMAAAAGLEVLSARRGTRCVRSAFELGHAQYALV